MNTCPISTLKAHSAGKIYAPILMAGKFQLKNSDGDVLIGFRGNAYNFLTLKNAETWLCSNLSRWANAEENTSVLHMAKLSKIYSYTREQYIINEIEAIQSFQNNEWQVVECAGRTEYIEVPAEVDYDGGNAEGLII